MLDAPCWPEEEGELPFALMPPFPGERWASAMAGEDPMPGPQPRSRCHYLHGITEAADDRIADVPGNEVDSAIGREEEGVVVLTEDHAAFAECERIRI